MAEFVSGDSPPPQQEFNMTYHEQQLIRERFPDPEERAQAEQRFLNGEPLAYVLGEWYFRRETYAVSPDCLIPRPETEFLVEAAVRLLPSGGRLLDLCTGSGCIPLSTLCERPDVTAAAVDLSLPALAIARKNAASILGADTGRILFLQQDVTAAPVPDLRAAAPFDVITANPPYIPSAVVDTLDPRVLREPRMALDGGPDGLGFYRAILTHFPSLLRPEGTLLFEIGFDQHDAILSLADSFHFRCEVRCDYASLPRLAILTSASAGRLTPTSASAGRLTPTSGNLSEETNAPVTRGDVPS